MNYEELLNECADENLVIKEKPLQSSNGRIYNNRIAIRHDMNTVDKTCTLAEELGHYYCNALYYLDSDKILKDKCEYRALKWAYSVLVPLQKLKEKIMQGFNLYDLADYFNVDCEYMNDCIDFYTEKYGILV